MKFNVLFIEFFLIISACCLFSCKEHADYSPLYLKNKLPENIEGSIVDFHVEEYKGKALSWDLRAERAYLLRNNSGTILNNFKLYYYENGRLSNEVKGEKGVLDSNKKTLSISGDVLVSSGSGRKIYAENALWSENTGKISSQDPVKIVLETGDIIKAGAFEADQDLEKIILKRGYGYHPSTENE